MTDVHAVVDEPTGLTAAWVTQVLRSAQLDVQIRDVRTERIGAGQIGTSYRLHLAYDQLADGAPSSLVVKLPGGDPAARQRVAPGYRKEVTFYRNIAHTVDVRRPHVWHAAITEDGTSFTLVLEDLDAARPGVQVDGCTIEQASDAVRNVAGLHAPRWNDPTLHDHSTIVPADEATTSFIGEILVDATEAFIGQYERQLTDDDKHTLRAAAAVNAAWQLDRSGPYSLVHGDYRLDNLMFPLDGDGVVALDWQTLSIGAPARDVAYFLGTSLPSDLRAAHERELVGIYHGELLDRGIADYPEEQCWDDYRLGQLQGPMITVLGCMYATAERSERADQMFLAMATRSAAAIRDLDPFAVLADRS